MTQELPFLDPKQPWYPPPIPPLLAQMLHAKLTGKRQDTGEKWTSFVHLSDQQADKLIANLRKDPRGFPLEDASTGYGSKYSEILEAYQKWLVAEYLPKSTGTESIQENKINLAGAPAPTRPMPHGEGQGPLPSVEIKKEEPEDEVEDDEIVEAVEEVVEEKNENEEEIKEKIREGVSPQIADTLTKYVNKSTGSKISTYKDDRESFKGDAKSVTNTVILDALISQFSSIKRSLDSVDAKLSEQNILIRASLGEAVNSLDSLESNSGTESKLDEIIAAYKAQDEKNEEARDQAEIDASIAEQQKQSDNTGTEGFTPGGTGGLLGNMMGRLFKQVMKFFRRGYKKLLRGIYRKLPKSWRSKIRGVTRGVRTVRNALNPRNIRSTISNVGSAVDKFKKSGGIRGNLSKLTNFAFKQGSRLTNWGNRVWSGFGSQLDDISRGIVNTAKGWRQSIGTNLDKMNPLKLADKVKQTLGGKIDGIFKQNKILSQLRNLNPKNAANSIRTLLKNAQSSKGLQALRTGLQGAKKMKIGGVDKVIAAIMGVIDYAAFGESPINAILSAIGGLLGYTAGFAIGAPFGGAPGFITGMAGAWVGEKASSLIAKGLAQTPLASIPDPIMNDGRMLVRDPGELSSQNLVTDSEKAAERLIEEKENKTGTKLTEAEKTDLLTKQASNPLTGGMLIPTLVEQQLDKPETPGELEKGGLVPYEMGGMYPPGEMLTASAGTLVGASRDFLDQAGPAADGVDIMFKEKAAKLQKTFKFPSTLAKTNVGGSFSGIRQINDVFSNQGVTYNEEQVKEMMKKMMGGSKPDPDGGDGGGDGGGHVVPTGNISAAPKGNETGIQSLSGGTPTSLSAGSTVADTQLHHGKENIRGGMKVRDYFIGSPTGPSDGSDGLGAKLYTPLGFGPVKYKKTDKWGIKFQDPNTGQDVGYYYHVDNAQHHLDGKILQPGTMVGTQGGLPGSPSGRAGSTAVHLHVEGTDKFHNAVISTYASGNILSAPGVHKAETVQPTQLDGSKTQLGLTPFTPGTSQQSQITPLSTVPQQPSANSVFFVPGKQPFLPLSNSSTPSIVHVSGINARQMGLWMNYR